MTAANSAGKLVIVSGPSGAGKTTVLRRVFQCAEVPLVASVSATTRRPRPGEVDGVDYHFLTDEEFHRHKKAGDFLECVEVFAQGYWYGTLQGQVSSGLAAGKWVVLEIDVQGALAVMERYPDAISIFVRPGSDGFLNELERRLRGRRTESEEAIQRRLNQAGRELEMADRYRYRVVNDDLDRAVREVCNILARESETDRDAR